MLRLLRREGLSEGYENRPIGRMILAGLRGELKTARYAMRSAPRVRFVLFAQGRTGSTLLTSTLDMHPEISCRDEILSQPRAFPTWYIENAARASGDQCFGFHVKIYQLRSWQRVDDVHAWLSALQRRGWMILYLRRENLLRHVVSNVFAEAAGAYHHSTSDPAMRPDRITLSADRLRAGIAGRRCNLAAERAALDGLDYLELVYERDLEPPRAQAETFIRIQSYLGVETIALRPVLRKAVAKPLEELIVNYEEVRNVLAGTPEEAFLHG